MYKKGIMFYPHEMSEKAVKIVFNGLKFQDREIKQILQDSYMLNLEQMVHFARKSHIDELEYILGIREILVKSGTAHER